MKSRIVGELKSVEYDPDFFESEPYPIPYFENNKLKVGFIEAEHQPYLDGADNVLENFLKRDLVERKKDSQLVFNYYNTALKYGYTKSLGIKKIDEVWNFVRPSEIIVECDESGTFYLNVSCECEWEEEHGLQLIFKDGLTLVRAGGHE